jgi:hypothetical protein
MAAHDSPGELSPKQYALLAAILTGKSTEAAAKSVLISPRTAYRWVKLPAFKVALAQGQQALFEENLGTLKQGVRGALTALARNMGENKPAGVQVRSAQIWLEQAIAIYKMNDLEARLEELEEQLGIKRREPR